MDENPKYPDHLADVIPAKPFTDVHGNHISRDWAVQFEQPRFELYAKPSLLGLADELYQPDYAWPNLNKLTIKIIDSISEPKTSASLIRRLVLAANQGSSVKLNSEDFTEYKSLISIPAVALLFSFIIIPVLAVATYCLARKIYRKKSGFFPENSSNVDAVYNVQTASQQYAFYSFKSGPPPLCLVATTIAGCFMALISLFALSSSLYFNEQFSVHLEKAQDPPETIFNVLTEYSNEIINTAESLGNAMSEKQQFGAKAFEALQDVSDDTVEKIFKTSGSDDLLMNISFWRYGAVEPMADAWVEVKEETSSLVMMHDDLKHYFGMRSNDINMWISARKELCSRFDTSAQCGANPVMRMSTLPPYPTDCYRCGIQFLPDKMDPLGRMNFTAFIDQTIRLTNEWKVHQLKDMVNRDLLEEEIDNMQSKMLDDFFEWITKYQHEMQSWFEWTKHPKDDEECKRPEPTTTKSSTTPTTIPSTTTSPSTTIATTATTPQVTSPTTAAITTTTTSATTTTTTTTEKPVTEEEGSEDILETIKRALEARNITTIVFLSIAVASMILTLTGCFCLFAVYLGKNSGISSNFRTQKITKLEAIGRACVLGAAVIFTVIAGPFLTVIAGVHFYAGGFVDNVVCKVVRTDNFTYVDEVFNTVLTNNSRSSNIIEEITPICYRNVIDEIDLDLLKKTLTVGQILSAGQHGHSLNQLLNLSETAYFRKFKTLETWNIPRYFSMFTPEMDLYFNNMSRITSRSEVLGLMLHNADLGVVDGLEKALTDCTDCVFNALPFPDWTDNSKYTEVYTDAFNLRWSLQSYAWALNKDVLHSWNKTIYVVKDAENMRKTFMKNHDFADGYFNNIAHLFKKEMRKILTNLTDEISTALVRDDIANLGPLWSIYQIFGRDFACTQLIGSMHAIWFFIGIYLVTASACAILGYAIAGTLDGLQEPDDVSGWETDGRFGKRHTAWVMVPVMTNTYGLGENTIGTDNISYLGDTERSPDETQS